jgi:hypothetical protein
MESAAPICRALVSSAEVTPLSARRWAWVAKVGMSSLRKPVSKLTTPPGQIARGEHFAEDRSRDTAGFGGEGDHGVAADDGGSDERDERQQGRFLRSEHADDAHRLGHGEVEVGCGHRIHVAEHLLVLVGPAGVVDHPVDAGSTLTGRGGHTPAERDRLRQLAGAGFDHLGEPIEDLAPVVGRAPGPAWTRLGGGLDGVAQVLAGALRNMPDERAAASFSGKVRHSPSG